MKQRVLTTAGLIVLLTSVFTLFGVDGAVWLLLIVTLATQYEVYSLFERMELSPDKFSGLLSGAAIILGSYYLVDPLNPPSLSAGNDVFLFCFIVLSLKIVGAHMVQGRINSFLPTLFGLLLAPYMLHYFIRLVRSVEMQGYTEGTAILMVVWLVLVAKLTDVGGLLAGLLFGHNALAPNLSPRKTIEGALGGVVLAALGSWLFATLVPDRYLLAAFTPLTALLLAIPIAIVGIFSDLLESAIKRGAGMKDSGTFVPGIGGAFDLTDSLILSAPFGYLLVKYTLF